MESHLGLIGDEKEKSAMKAMGSTYVCGQGCVHGTWDTGHKTQDTGHETRDMEDRIWHCCLMQLPAGKFVP